MLPAKQKKSEKPLLLQFAEKYGMDEKQFWGVIKKTIVTPKKVKDSQGNVSYKEATDEEVYGFLSVANRYGLDPLTRQIAAFVSERGGAIVPMVTIDGWITLTNNQKRYAGMEQESHVDAHGNVYAITTTMFVKDSDLPGGVRKVQKTEWLKECKRNTDPWTQMPNRMLGHKSYIQCARYAFGFSGLYDEDEARDIAEAVDVTPGAPSLTERVKSLSPAPNPAPVSPEGGVNTPATPVNPVSNESKGKETGGNSTSNGGNAPPNGGGAPPAQTPKALTDEDKQNELLAIVALFTLKNGGSTEDAVKKFSGFIPEGKTETVSTGNIKKLTGRWLNTTLGNARKWKEEHGDA